MPMPAAGKTALRIFWGVMFCVISSLDALQTLKMLTGGDEGRDTSIGCVRKVYGESGFVDTGGEIGGDAFEVLHVVGVDGSCLNFACACQDKSVIDEGARKTAFGRL